MPWVSFLGTPKVGFKGIEGNQPLGPRVFFGFFLRAAFRSKLTSKGSSPGR